MVLGTCVFRDDYLTTSFIQSTGISNPESRNVTVSILTQK